MEKEKFILDFIAEPEKYYIYDDDKMDIALNPTIGLSDVVFYRIDRITYEEKAPRKEALENVLSAMRIVGVNFLYLIKGSNVNIFSRKAHIGSLGSFIGIGVSQQPLVPCPQPVVLVSDGGNGGLGLVGPLRQHHRHSETIDFTHMAGRVVQCGCIDLHSHPGGDPECLDAGGVQLAIRDLVLLRQQENELTGTDIDLAVPVVLQAVEPGIAAPAHTDLDRHTAVGVVLELTEDGGCFQGGDGRLVGHACFRQGDALHGSRQRRRVIAGQDLTVGLERSVVNGFDFHKSLPNSALQAG